MHQINDGTPAEVPVAAFNTLMAPLVWNDIGSKIMFSVASGSIGDIKNQVYPTYYIYIGKNRTEIRPQAPDPAARFNLDPYPPGPPFPPFIFP